MQLWPVYRGSPVAHERTPLATNQSTRRRTPEREFDTSVEVERCIDDVALSEDQAAQLWLREALFADLQGTTAIELTAGTYRIDVRRQYAEPHPVWLRIEGDPG